MSLPDGQPEPGPEPMPEPGPGPEPVPTVRGSEANFGACARNSKVVVVRNHRSQQTQVTSISAPPF